MSFFNALLGAMNTGAGAYNDEKGFQNTLIKDKASIDNTRSNTALNNQKFDFNDMNNPLMIKSQEIANQIEGNKFTDSQRRLDDRTAFMANPDIAQSLKDAWQMNYATGGKSFSPSKGDSAKPTILGTYNDAGFRTGNAVFDENTNTGIPINMQGQGNGQPAMDIQKVLGDAMGQTYGTQEFNSNANQADFNVRANEVYQSFLQQTNNPQQAQELTKQHMFKTLGLDDDYELGIFSDKELNYNPANQSSGVQSQPQLPVVASDQDFLALPKGSKFIDPNGNVRVK